MSTIHAFVRYLPTPAGVLCAAPESPPAAAFFFSYYATRPG
jgi:hypothetical protein